MSILVASLAGFLVLPERGLSLRAFQCIVACILLCYWLMNIPHPSYISNLTSRGTPRMERGLWVIVESETAIQLMTDTGDFYFNLGALTPGTTYYFRAKAAGSKGPVYGEEKTFTKGTAPDEAAPATPQVADEGDSTSTTTDIHAKWSSSDAEPGMAEYVYGVGRSAGGNDLADRTFAGTATETTTLTPGQTCYGSVRTLNGQGLWSDVSTSNDITVSPWIVPRDGWSACASLLRFVYYELPVRKA